MKQSYIGGAKYLPMRINKRRSPTTLRRPFSLSGEGGGQYIVSIKNGACTVNEGIAENPDVTVSASAADYMDIVTGAYPFGLAFINGRL